MSKKSKPNHLFSELAKSGIAEARQKEKKQIEALEARLFLQQYDAYKDESYYKAVRCPRRAGKSYFLLVYATIVCLSKPGARCLILARVLRQARAVYWREVKKLCREMEIDAHFRNMRMEVEFANGSVLQFGGADTAEECDKYRGLGLDWVGVDECKSYPLSLLRELLLEILEPALADRDGTLVLIGTPGPVLAGPFYAVTTGDLSVIPEQERAFWSSKHWNNRDTETAKWTFHTWTAKDNTAKPNIWRRFMKMKEDSGLRDDDPVWVREYLGQWVPDADALVYAYSRVNEDGRCNWEQDGDGPFGLPGGHYWKFILGLDLGWHDATAFVVGAWSETHPGFYFVHVEKHSYMDIRDISDRTKELQHEYGDFQVMVADTGGLGRQIIESLASIYGLAFETAEKRDKVDFIKLMNSDLQEGKILLSPYSELAEEWRNIQWDGVERRKIDKSCIDHAADAALYLWRYAYHHFWEKPAESPDPGTSGWWQQLMDEQEAKACEQEKSRQTEQGALGGFAHLLDKMPWN